MVELARLPGILISPSRPGATRVGRVLLLLLSQLMNVWSRLKVALKCDPRLARSSRLGRYSTTFTPRSQWQHQAHLEYVGDGPVQRGEHFAFTMRTSRPFTHGGKMLRSKAPSCQADFLRSRQTLSRQLEFVSSQSTHRRSVYMYAIKQALPMSILKVSATSGQLC